MIRLLLADDQTLFRTMLSSILEASGEIRVVASAADGRQAVEMAAKYKPDIVLLDLKMPVKSGIEALQEIKELNPEIKIAVLTTFDDVNNVISCAASRADAYLIKDIEPDILIMAIKCILADLAVVHQSAFSIICPDRDCTQAQNRKLQLNGASLNKTDLIILKMIARGSTNREIAQTLHYSEGTVKNRISSLLSASGLPDRSALSVCALKNRII